MICTQDRRGPKCHREAIIEYRALESGYVGYFCVQCWTADVAARNDAWRERYRMYRLLRELRVERDGGWRSYVMRGRAAHAWKRLAKRLRDELDEWKRTARQNEREAMAARDGLTIWKRRAEEAEAKVSREADLQVIISDTAAVLAELTPDACGTLAERVRAALSDSSSNHKETK